MEVRSPELRKGIFYMSPIYPAALAAGNNNNWNPEGISTANVIVVTPDAGGTSVLTGLRSGSHGRVITLFNDVNVNLTFNHHDANSDVGNRFHCPGGVPLVIGGFAAATFWYDGVHGHWRIASWA